MKLRAQAFVTAAFIAGCAHSPDPSRSSQTTSQATSQATTTGASFTLPGSTNTGSHGVDPFTPENTSPELAEPGHPANRLGAAACERKQECDEIGDGKSHASRQACLTTTRRHAHEELTKLSCENGIDDAAFESCLKSVRIAECALVDSITRQDACAKHTLCTH
jgi:hypothetical protein